MKCKKRYEHFNKAYFPGIRNRHRRTFYIRNETILRPKTVFLLFRKGLQNKAPLNVVLGELTQITHIDKICHNPEIYDHWKTFLSLNKKYKIYYIIHLIITLVSKKYFYLGSIRIKIDPVAFIWKRTFTVLVHLKDT